jgi:uncharacterized protein YkwD
MLYWINLARTNPPAAAQRIAADITPDIQATLQHFGVNLSATEQAIASAAPLPPLAWNNQLAQAAQGHSQDMANKQYQSHTGSDGSSPQQRMQQAGYTGASSSAENAYAYASSVEESMQAFLIDWGVPDNGHRNNLLQPGVSAQNSYRDVGIGLVQTSSSTFGPLVVTQDFGAQPNSPAQVVGVAYNPANGDPYYESNEGAANVQIDAVNLKTGQVTSTQTGAFGGYQMALAPGSYRLIASVNDDVIKTVDITVGNTNIEQDFTLNGAWQGGSREGALTNAMPTSSSPVVRQPQQPAPPQSPQTQPGPVGIGALSWNWTDWKAGVKS